MVRAMMGTARNGDRRVSVLGGYMLEARVDPAFLTAMARLPARSP